MFTVGNFAYLVILNDKITKLSVGSADDGRAATLPDGFPKDKIDDFFSEFKSHFNSKSEVEFYGLFSEWTQAQMNENEVKENYENLRQLFGEVEKATYSHFEIEGKQDQRTFVLLNYIAQTEKRNGPVSLQLGIYWDGQESGFYRTYMSL